MADSFIRLDDGGTISKEDGRRGGAGRPSKVGRLGVGRLRVGGGIRVAGVGHVQPVGGVG